MIQKKMDYSTTNTASTRFVPEQNAHNLAKSVQKATLLLFLFFITCASYAQNVTIVGDPAAYYCGQVVTLKANDFPNANYGWIATGGIRLRRVTTTGAGQNAVLVPNSNLVEAIINGSGTVSYGCISGCSSTGSISLSPSPATLNQISITSSTDINQANGIQTTKNWICVKNNGTTETITVRNPSPLNIFWVVSGGAIKMGETQAVVGGLFTYTVTVATSGSTAGKGSIRAFVSDPCGTLTCDPALDWEILKDLMPSEIAGPTCLRNNNLDASGTVVYSITDEFAGNAVYEWELLQDGVPVDVNRTDFKIRSQVLYGNSATIEYNGVVPSDIGNFSLKITNSCSPTAFIRDITVSPAKPVLSQLTYCVSDVSGTTETITLPALLTGQTYSVTPQGNVNWTVLDVSAIAPNPPNTFEITFNDAVSGAIEVRAGSSNDPGCTSEGTLIYFNREGGTPTITGPACVTRNTTDAFSFTASPFGQYTWSVSPALPAGFVTSSGGNVFTVNPPAGGINVSGNYTVTATLAGCSSAQDADFDFEIGAAKPTITNGLTCLAPIVLLNNM